MQYPLPFVTGKGTPVWDAPVARSLDVSHRRTATKRKVPSQPNSGSSTRKTDSGSHQCASDEEEEPFDAGEMQNAFNNESDGPPSAVEHTHSHRRKRLHLDSEDVGRFASMSIGPEPMSDPQPTTPTLLMSDSDGMFNNSSAPPSTPVASVKQASLLPSAWEIDAHTTYIHDLDAASGEDLKPGDESPIQDKLSIDAVRQLQNVDSSRAGDMHDGSAQDILLQINPELLAKLEAHSRGSLVSDMSVRRSSRGPTQDEAKGALVLWKSPQALFRTAEAGSAQSTDMSASPSPALSPSLVNSSSVFSFGSASASPAPTFAPFSAPPTQSPGDDMELDDEI